MPPTRKPAKPTPTVQAIRLVVHEAFCLVIRVRLSGLSVDWVCRFHYGPIKLYVAESVQL